MAELFFCTTKQFERGTVDQRSDVSGQFANNHLTERCSGSKAGSYLRRIDSCITQLKAQGPAGTCNESKQDKERRFRTRRDINVFVPARIQQVMRTIHLYGRSSSGDGGADRDS